MVKFLRLGIAAVFFVPLIYSSATIFPFIFPKSLAFRALIELLLAPYLYLVLTNPEYRPKRSNILIAIFAFFGIEILATIFSVDPSRSFWGNHERMMGLYAYAHVVLFFLIATSVYRTKNEWRRLILYAIISGAIVTMLGYIQHFSTSFLHEVKGGRIFSTFGNSIYLSAYLLFQIYLLFWYALSEKRLAYKMPLFSLLALEIIAFFWARTRGAFIALIVSGIVLILLSAWHKLRSRPRLLAGAALLPVAVFFLLFIFKDISVLKNNKFLAPITQLSAQEVTAKTRLLNWKIGLHAWTARPLLGWGPENYYFGFNKFYDPKFLQYSNYETWQDHAHNFLIDTLSDSGILGLLAFLGIFFFVIKELFLLGKKQGEKSTSIIFLSIIVAYFVQNLFAFDTLAIWIMIYTIFGYIHIRSVEAEKIKEVKEGPAFLRLDPVTRMGLCLGTALIMVMLIIFTNIIPFTVSAKTISAGEIFSRDPGAAYNMLTVVLEKPSPYKAESRDEFSKIVTAILQNAQNLTRDDASRFALKVREEYKKNIIAHPRDVFINLANAQWNMVMASVFDPVYFLDAEEYLLRAKELSPRRQQIYYLLIRLYILRGRFVEAAFLGKEVVELNPKISQSHWIYGEALSRSGETVLGFKEMRGALHGEFGGPYIFWSLPEMDLYINIAKETGDKEEVAWRSGILEHSQGRYPEAYAKMKKAIDGGLIPETREQLVKYLDLSNSVNKPLTNAQIFALMGKYAASELGADSELASALAAENRERAFNLNAQIKKSHPILAEKILQLSFYLDKTK